MKNTDELIGQSLGGYKVISKLGAGGMGAVYRAMDVELDKLVAIKVLPPHAIHDEDAIERFRREARVAAKLEHPNIVTIYRFGSEQSLCYLVMRYVEGESLADRLMTSPQLSLKDALTVIYEVASGLKCAHDEGLVHRDIKPANILLSKKGEVLVADFGLAKQTGNGAGGLTATGMIMGTPDYMAPEQCEGEPDIDGRADLYSLGLVFYTMLTGKVPSEGKTPLQIIMNRVQKAVPPPRLQNPDIPADVDRLIMDMLEGDRQKRIQKADEILARIEGFPQYEGRGTGRLKRVILGANDPTIMVPPPPVTPAVPVKARLVSRPIVISDPGSTKASVEEQVSAREKTPSSGDAKRATIQILPDKPVEIKKGIPTGKVLRAKKTTAQRRPKSRKPAPRDHDDYDRRPEPRSSNTTLYVILSLLVVCALMFLCCILAAAGGQPM